MPLLAGGLSGPKKSEKKKLSDADVVESLAAVGACGLSSRCDFHRCHSMSGLLLRPSRRPRVYLLHTQYRRHKESRSRFRCLPGSTHTPDRRLLRLLLPPVVLLLLRPLLLLFGFLLPRTQSYFSTSPYATHLPNASHLVVS